MIKTILFDLDGTLLDTAPDFIFAINTLLQEEGRSPITLPTLLPAISHGTNAMVQQGFGITHEDAEFSRLRQRFLEIHYDHIVKFTRLFTGISDLLTTLNQQGLQWGIVTNKSEHLTKHLLSQFNFPTPPACVVCGDTLPTRKPDPAPIWYACELSCTDPSNTLFIGDAQSDITAGLRANVTTLVALYGYIAEGVEPTTWGAHGAIAQPAEVLWWIKANFT
jgi:2-phosphoglycolate phosphatase